MRSMTARVTQKSGIRPTVARGRRASSTASTKASAVPSAPVTAQDHSWTFLTNHAHVLLCLAAAEGDVRVRDIAERVGITERAVQRILSELEDASYIERSREGRRNFYEVRTDLPLRHPIEAHRSVKALIDLVR